MVCSLLNQISYYSLGTQELYCFLHYLPNLQLQNIQEVYIMFQPANIQCWYQHHIHNNIAAAIPN